MNRGPVTSVSDTLYKLQLHILLPCPVRIILPSFRSEELHRSVLLSGRGGERESEREWGNGGEREGEREEGGEREGKKKRRKEDLHPSLHGDSLTQSQGHGCGGRTETH